MKDSEPKADPQPLGYPSPPLSPYDRPIEPLLYASRTVQAGTQWALRWLRIVGVLFAAAAVVWMLVMFVRLWL